MAAFSISIIIPFQVIAIGIFLNAYFENNDRTLRRHLLANSLHHCYLKRHLMIVLGVDWVGMQDAHCRGQSAM